MAGTKGRRSAVRPAAVVVEHEGKRVTFWFSTTPNAAIAEQMINTEYGDDVAGLELRPDIHVNLSHGKIHDVLSALGMTRIPGDGEESDDTPEDTGAEESTPEESTPEPVKPATTRGTRRPTTTGGRRRAGGA